MRFIVSILLIAVFSVARAQQPDKGALYHAIEDFDKALETRDSLALKHLLSNDVSYGHSNGWVETKAELIRNLYNGTLNYTKIKASKPEVKISGNSAWMRNVADIDAVMGGNAMSFKLKVLQVWNWENEHWVLFARQSVSIGKDK